MRKELHRRGEDAGPLHRRRGEGRGDGGDFELKHVVQRLARAVCGEFLLDLAVRDLREQKGGEHLDGHHAQQDVLQHAQVPQRLIHDGRLASRLL